MMKRILFFLAIAMAMVGSAQAAQVSVTDARQVADQFFRAKSTRLSAPSSQSTTRLAYTADHERFFVFDRGVHSGFVVVAGDDRLPQVLGYGMDFSADKMPPAMRYWMDEMSRQIAFLQSHPEAKVHRPAPRVNAVAPLMTTMWDQGEPYNNYCPYYYNNNGDSARAVTGCVATATAQVMNYNQWPDVGRGSHSYTCNVNDMTVTELSADYSQSVYRWDLMLDTYDASSSPESCDAVAKLMSDVGISMNMGYGASSGAQETVAMRALVEYFKYSNKCYILNRDYYGADEWDQFLVDEISALRPIIYCGYTISSTDSGGHAFVLDGFDNNGYFHVNWGWGGSSDGYFLVSLLAPGSGMNFEYMQDGIFGLVPEHQADLVDKVLNIRTQLIPVVSSVPLGERKELFKLDNFVAEGNALDTAGYFERNGRRYYYAEIPMSLGVYDKDGVLRQSEEFIRQQVFSGYWFNSDQRINMTLLNSLENGEYLVKLAYQLEDEGNYDHRVMDYSGKELYVKMTVSDGTAHLTDCFLSNTYGLGSVIVPAGIMVNQPIDVNVSLSYNRPWGGGGEDGPLGTAHLSLLKDGVEVATSEPYEVMVPVNTVQSYQMQITAPAEWGRYELMVNDESGNTFVETNQWNEAIGDGIIPIMVLPVCQQLVEDFETMTANSSSNDKDVQGLFTTWSFTKSGVRAPGEGRCNGINSVMLKKASSFGTSQPMAHNFIMAQATFFNQSSTAAKYKLESSTDGGATWVVANTIDDQPAADVPANSVTSPIWKLNLTAAQPAIFRIAMIAGGSASTYVDDVSFYYNDTVGDVNGDGEVNIADINAVITVILTNGDKTAADVNGDGEVNIADINAIINLILS